MNKKHLIVLSLVFLMGCTATKKVATATSAPQKASAETIAQGKDLYENRCGKCHKLFAPTDYAVKQWPEILNSMQSKAKITDEQKAQIYAYLSASAKN